MLHIVRNKTLANLNMRDPNGGSPARSTFTATAAVAVRWRRQREQFFGSQSHSTP